MVRYSLGYEHNEDLIEFKKYTFSLTPIVTIDEQWRIYTELHGYKQDYKISFPAMLYIASGLQFSATNNLRFDINAGYNFNKRNTSLWHTAYYYGLGIVYRFN